jgi:sugar phosphate isomerase/epimerase
MKLGFITAAMPAEPLEEIFSWAEENQFTMIEVLCWPWGQEAERRYAGVSHIDVVNLTPKKVAEIKDLCAIYGAEISALGYYPNFLHPDVEHRKSVREHIRHVIKAAGMLGVPVVNTFVGRDWTRGVEENLQEFTLFFPGLVKFAADNNVKIAIENCPMLYEDTWPGGTNLAFSPEIWDRMFEIIPDDNFGLNMDPSHLIWLGVDYVQVIHDYAGRIFHTHAKDTLIRGDLLSYASYLGFGWHTDKLPGLGDIDWGAWISALYEVGYDYVVAVEHEDRAWESSPEHKKRGLLMARNFLSAYIA